MQFPDPPNPGEIIFSETGHLVPVFSDTKKHKFEDNRYITMYFVYMRMTENGWKLTDKKQGLVTMLTAYAVGELLSQEKEFLGVSFVRVLGLSLKGKSLRADLPSPFEKIYEEQAVETEAG